GHPASLPVGVRRAALVVRAALPAPGAGAARGGGRRAARRGPPAAAAVLAEPVLAEPVLAEPVPGPALVGPARGVVSPPVAAQAGAGCSAGSPGDWRPGQIGWSAVVRAAAESAAWS